MGNTIGTRKGSSISGARLDHVAFGVESMQRAAEFIVGTLGGVPHEGGPGPGYTGAQWKFENGARIELIEPSGSDGFLHRFIRARGPGIHHVTFIVPKLELAARAAETLGYEVVGYNDAYPSWKECFLHPKQALGVVVQMAEKSDVPDGGNTWGAGFPFPGATAVAPSSRVVALRFGVPHREAALTQWGELLGGRLEGAASGPMTFTWTDSPIRLVVDVDPGAPAGPKYVEVTSRQPMSLPADPPPALGSRFVNVAFDS